MLKIEQLSDEIEEELHDAEKYIDCALKEKDEYPSIADAHAKLSAEEMGHVNILHDQVTALIADYRKKNGEPPEKMLDRYEYIHKKHKEKANTIRLKQMLFKG